MQMNGRSFGLDKTNGKIMGVCAGLAVFSGIEALWWRVGFVVGTVLGAGVLILVYLAIGLLADSMPQAN